MFIILFSHSNWALSWLEMLGERKGREVWKGMLSMESGMEVWKGKYA